MRGKLQCGTVGCKRSTPETMRNLRCAGHGQADQRAALIGQTVAIAMGRWRSRSLPPLSLPSPSPSLASRRANGAPIEVGDARKGSCGNGHPGARGGMPTHPSPHPARRGGDPTNIFRVPSHSISLDVSSSPAARPASLPSTVDTQHRFGDWSRSLPHSALSVPLDRYPIFSGYGADEWWLPPLDLLERYSLEPVFLVERSDAQRRKYFWRAMCAARRAHPSRMCPKSMDRRMRRYTKPYPTVRQYFKSLELEGWVPVGMTRIARKLALELCGRSPGSKAPTHIEPRGPKPEQKVRVVPHTARPVYE